MHENIKINKMKRLNQITFVLFVIFIAGTTAVSGQDAKTVLGNMDKIFFSPKDKQGKVEIIMTDKAGNEKVREAEMFQKGADRKLYRYTKPESQSGVATLSLPNDEMWLYMPAYDQAKKISMLARNQSFTGTDFSYEDMATTPYASRYNADSLVTEKDQYIMRLLPKVENSTYSKIIVRVNKLNGYPVLMEFYNLKGVKFKEATYKYEKIGAYWNAAEVVMKDLVKKQSTKILLTDVKFNQGLSDDLFTVEKLRPVRIK